MTSLPDMISVLHREARILGAHSEGQGEVEEERGNPQRAWLLASASQAPFWIHLTTMMTLVVSQAQVIATDRIPVHQY